MRKMMKPANDEVTQTIQVFAGAFSAATAERIARVRGWRGCHHRRLRSRQHR